MIPTPKRDRDVCQSLHVALLAPKKRSLPDWEEEPSGLGVGRPELEDEARKQGCGSHGNHEIEEGLPNSEPSHTDEIVK